MQPDGSVSFTQGYGPNYELPPSNPSYLDVERAKMNYLLNLYSTILQGYQQQCIPPFITSAQNNGSPYPYAQYALVMQGGIAYQSQVSSNTDTPPTSNWAPLPLPLSGFTTGDFKLTLKTAPDNGWVFCNDGTIGSASSGATNRANADTQALYTVLWNNVSNTYAPVAGGRGANAAADFAANKAINLTLMVGRALAIAGSGAGLTPRTLGQTVGDENLQNHTHTVNDPSHAHPYPQYNAGGNSNICGNSFASTGYTYAAVTNISINPAGTGSGGNMQPTSFINAMIKL